MPSYIQTIAPVLQGHVIQ